MRYLVRVGYNPLGSRQVMEILASLDAAGRPPEFLSTHPYPEKRVENIQGKLDNEYAYTQNNAEFRLGEQEFRTKFLDKLAVAYPDGREEDPLVREFAIRGSPACSSCSSCSTRSR